MSSDLGTPYAGDRLDEPATRSPACPACGRHSQAEAAFCAFCGTALVHQRVPGPPVFDAETAEQIRTLLAKGGTSGVFLVTDDCQQAYKELSSRGVEFQESPEERPYGIDAGFRDPSGNNFRLTQLKDLG